MAIWQITAGQNDGYPLYDDGATTSLSLWMNGVELPNHLWRIIPDTNDDYPTLSFDWVDITSIFDGIIPVSIWRIVDGINDNYPYRWYQIAVESGYINQGDAVIGSDTDMQEYIDDVVSGDNVFDDIKYTGETITPDFSSPRSMLGDAFTTFYGLSVYDVLDVASGLGTAPATFWQALGTATDYKFTNLIDYVVGFKWYPFHIPDVTDTHITSVQFGFSTDSALSISSDTGYESYKISSAEKQYYHGEIYIPTKYDKFCYLDTEPYSNVAVYLPYVGEITLHSRDIIGQRVTIRSVLDLSTGMLSYYVSNENYTCYQGSAQIGSDIMIAGNDIYTQSQKYVGAVLQTSQNAVRGIVGLTGAIVSKNPVAIGETAMNFGNTIAHDAMSIADAKHAIPETVGSGSGFGATFCNPYPSIIVKRPAVVIPATYGKTTGYACSYTARLSSVSGFTVCKNPDLSGISESPAMLNELYNILSTGFYA